MKKLRSKSTGNFVEPIVLYYDDLSKKQVFEYIKDDGKDGIAYYDTLYNFWEAWEVVDVDMKYSYMGNSGKVYEESEDKESPNREDRKLIGNDFKTKADCEHAVDKLKALARLRQKGLIFCGWSIRRGVINFVIDEDKVAQDGIIDDDVLADFNLLFSGNDRKSKKKGE